MKEPPTGKPLPDDDEAPFSPAGPDELRAERAIRVWILIALVVAVIVAMAMQLASRDMNRAEPTIESQ